MVYVCLGLRGCWGGHLGVNFLTEVRVFASAGPACTRSRQEDMSVLHVLLPAAGTGVCVCLFACLPASLH